MERAGVQVSPGRGGVSASNARRVSNSTESVIHATVVVFALKFNGVYHRVFMTPEPGRNKSGGHIAKYGGVRLFTILTATTQFLCSL